MICRIQNGLNHPAVKLTTQPAITCSKLTIETLEQDVKYAIGVVLVSLLLTVSIFHPLF